MTAKRKAAPKKKPAPRRKSAASRGLLEGAGARIDDALHRLLRLIISYTAIAAASGAVILVLMLFAGGYFFNAGGRLVNLSHTMARTAGYEVQRVTLTGGRQTARPDIMQALYDPKRGSVMGQSILHYDAGDARARLEQIGWVKHAAVSRLWPDTVHVSIEERIPAALWQSPGEGLLYLVDAEGAVITPVGGHQYTGLPVIMDADDPSAAEPVMSALRAYPDVNRKIAALQQHGGRRWDVIFRNDFVVKLPERDVGVAIERMVKLHRIDGADTGKLEYFDLRNEKSAYYKARKTDAD